MSLFKGFCVRIDALETYREKILMLTAVEDYLSILGVQHQGVTKENPHFHLVIESTIDLQAFRKRMKKIFNLSKGNGNMSIKPWDGNEDAYSYLFHEDPNSSILVQKGIADTTITKAKDRNLAVQREIQQSKGKATWRAEDIVRKQLDAKRPEKYYHREVCAMLYRACLTHGKYPPNEYKAKQMVAKLRWELYEGDEVMEEEMIDTYVNSVYKFQDRS